MLCSVANQMCVLDPQVKSPARQRSLQTAAAAVEPRILGRYSWQCARATPGRSYLYSPDPATLPIKPSGMRLRAVRTASGVAVVLRSTTQRPRRPLAQGGESIKQVTVIADCLQHDFIWRAGRNGLSHQVGKGAAVQDGGGGCRGGRGGRTRHGRRACSCEIRQTRDFTIR